MFHPSLRALLLHHKSEYLVIEDTPNTRNALSRSSVFLIGVRTKESMFDYFPPSYLRTRRRKGEGYSQACFRRMSHINLLMLEYGSASQLHFDISKGLSVTGS